MALYSENRDVSTVRSKVASRGAGAQESRQVRVLSSEDVLQWRRERTAPIFTAFKQWLDDLLPGTAPQSALGKAVAYSVRQWPKLVLHQQHGEVPIHNNATENEIRPFSQGCQRAFSSPQLWALKTPHPRFDSDSLQCGH
jgi:hypothetical protein